MNSVSIELKQPEHMALFQLFKVFFLVLNISKWDNNNSYYGVTEP